MINQVGCSNPYKNVFVPFKGDDGTNIAVSKPDTQPQNDEFKKEEEVKKEKEQKSNKFGYSIAALALIVGFGLLALSKFFSKGTGMKANRILKKNDRTTDKAGREGLWGGAKRVFNKILENSQVVFNIATLKDILFVKSLKKIPLLKEGSKFVTEIFEKWSIRTSRKAYQKTTLSFESMYGKFTDASKKIKDQKIQDDIARKIQSIRDNYYHGFGEAARNERLAHVQTGLQDLDEKVWRETYGNPKGFWKRIKDGEFIAAQNANDTKFKLLSDVTAARFKITNSSLDCYHATKDFWDKLHSRIPEADEPAKKAMETLAGYLNDYKSKKKALGSEINIHFPKDDVLNDLKTLREHIAKPSNYYTEKKVKTITKAIESLEQSMSQTKQGEIHEIMDIYRKNLNKKDCDALQKSVNKSLKSFTNATELEHEKLFDKIRDLKLGSAPHDVLAFLASLGFIGWGVSKSENKDERISVTLKYAIPALFGVAMAIGCTVGLIASGPSLLIGLASTIPINMIGKAIDNARKKTDDDSQAKVLPNIDLKSPMKIIKNIENNCKSV